MRSLLSLIARLRGSSDLVLALLALGVLSLLITPIPPWLLDLGIALNLTLAATILVMALFARHALSFACFPALLLFTTLFRIALAVGATRLVLSRGEAGQVIQAFGRVVVGGSYVVGAVVYAILTLAQLLVISKGAERVAEVAARFNLDALPGKQLAIDADLRAGTFTSDEAHRRRRSLERESQLYGAMDGALKFVKGDAVAGVAIVLVNVVGGLATGVTRGLSLSSAAKRYALLAIGDGLAALVPALLIAIAAGVVVTRVAPEEEGHGLSAELAQQLFADPRALLAVAALCGTLALLPGLPIAPFALPSAAAMTGAWLLLQRERSARDLVASPPLERTSPEGPSPLTLEWSDDLARLAEEGQGHFARASLPALQIALSEELGIPLPPVSPRTRPWPPGRWRLLLDEIPIAEGSAPTSEVLVLAPASELEVMGISATPDLDPITGDAAARAPAIEARRAAALWPVRPPLERIGASLAASLRAHAPAFLGVQEVQLLLDRLGTSHPVLIQEVTRRLPLPLLSEALRRLLEEGLSVRPLRTILESLIDAPLLEADPVRSLDALVEAGRRALQWHIAHHYAGDGALEALLLDPAAEIALRTSMQGTQFALDPGALRALLDRLGSRLAEHEGRLPILLVNNALRRPLRQVIAARFPRLAVLAYQDLPPHWPIHPIGKLTWDQRPGEATGQIGETTAR